MDINWGFLGSQTRRSFSLARRDAPKCYGISGETVTDNYACNVTAEVSHCCGLGWDCLDNGLCQAKGFWPSRGTCTDPTWSTDECHRYCPEQKAPNIISCTNVTGSDLDVCCGSNGGCCNLHTGIFKLDKAGTALKKIVAADVTATRPPAPTSTSATSSAVPATQTVTAVPSSSSSSDSSSSSSGLSGGAKAGIAVGVVVAVLAIAGLLFLLWRQRRKAAAQPPEEWAMKHDFNQSEATPETHYSSPPSEMDGQRRSELMAGHQSWELPGQQHAAFR